MSLASAQPAVVPTARITGALSFDARASLGPFTGTSSAVTGAISGGPTLGRVQGWIETRVDSLHTGNGRRDRDMLSTMEATKYPIIRFDLAEVRPSPMQGDEMVATLVGRFTIHGVTREVSLPATLTWSPGAIHLTALLGLDVREYGVTKLSRFLGTLRMQPDIVVRIDLTVAQPAP